MGTASAAGKFVKTELQTRGARGPVCGHIEPTWAQ
jgi:hypothetical protein